MTTLLDLIDAALAAEEATRTLADQMVAALREHAAGNDGWRSAGELALDLGYPTSERGKRAVRAAANASNGRIISGQKGYKLTCDATPAEIHHAAAWLEAQAREMAARACAIRRAWHAYGATGMQEVAS